MDGMTRVRFVRSSRHGKEGEIKELFDGVATTLIRRRFCVPVGGPVEVETACVEPPVRRKRGRPRKVRASGYA
jgi:hypothetical protein